MKNFAVNLALRAGDYLLREFKKSSLPPVRYKDTRELVTAADFDSEKIILQAITKKYPTHQILSEERGLVGLKSEYLWLVDPLDGTSNFSIKNPLFGVSLALLYKKETILGVNYVPYLQELYLAEKGRGAYLNGKKIRVSRQNRLKDSVIVYCSTKGGHRLKKELGVLKGFKKKVRALKQIGSAVVELGWLACGRCEVVIAPITTPWDIGAGVLLIKEAGGQASDWRGKKKQIYRNDFVATNGILHAEILNILKAI